MDSQYVWTPEASGSGSVSIVFAQAIGFDYTIVGLIGTASNNAGSVITMTNIIKANLTTYLKETGPVSLPPTSKDTNGQAFFYSPSAGYRWQFDGSIVSPCTVTLIAAGASIAFSVAFRRQERARV